MNTWTKWHAVYTDADETAFRDARRINAHFGLPLPNASRVFSLSLNSDGRSNVHDFGKKYRSTYLGNTWAYRYIKSLYPDAWIWDERYRFSTKTSFSKDMRILHAQTEFIKLLGADCIKEIRARALSSGLNPDTNTGGRPDLAAHFPGQEVPWRFIEIKIPERGDKLGEKQTDCLRLFASFFGGEGAVELELSKAEM
jgi:hypothetical protein